MAKKRTLAAILKDADERVKKAAADALNEASREIVSSIEANISHVGIHNRTWTLAHSIETTEATEKRLNVTISSEVFKPAPKRPGLYNPKMRGRYKQGTPYGRIIEFSPRINMPFFYTAWYQKRDKVKDEIIEKVGEAWSNG